MLLKYSNGYGHLIMSVVMALIGLILIIAPITDASTKAVGVGLIFTVSGAWFVPNAARQVIREVTQPLSTQEEDKNNAN